MVSEELKRRAFENIKQKPMRIMLSPATHNPILNDIAAGICPVCGKKLGEFRDLLSEREYIISGMCQNCQDTIFRRR